MAALELFNTTLFNDANLVSYYRLEGNSNDAKDGNNGTDTSITYNSGNGKFGQGAGCNGSSSNISVADATNLKITGNFTLMCWVNFSALPSSGNVDGFIAKRYNDSNIAGQGTNYDIFLLNNAGTYQLIGRTTPSGTGEISASYNWSVSTGTWYMITLTWDGSTLTLYVNGSSVATASGTGSLQTSTVPFLIGARGNAGSPSVYHNGPIDDVAIFSRALSATEVSNHYNGSDAPVKGGLFYNQI